jgi:SSS family transporter
LSTIDLIIIAAYLVAVVGAGAWFGRRQQTTSRYFLAGHGMPWWAIGASIVATETSTITFISVPGIAYARGGNFTFLQLVFGYLAGRVVISILFIPSYFRGELVTVYELLQGRFGAKVRALAASLFVTARTIADGVRLLLTAFVLAAVYGSVSGVSAASVVTTSVIVIGIVMIVFTFFGGMEAVVWIEVVQLGIYIAGALAAGIVLVHSIDGGWSAAMALGEAHGKFRLFDFALDATKTFTFWAGLIGGCFLTMSTHGTDQYLVQRYLCTDRPRRAALALLTSGVVILAQFIGFLFIGVLLFAFYRPDKLPSYATGAAAAPFAAADQVFPDFITRHLPTGLSGLVVAAIFAAAMSSSLNSIAAAFVSDLYTPLARGRSDRHYLNVSRLVTIVAGILQIVVALALTSTTQSALATALSVASLINGPILGVFLLGSLRRGGPAAALGGMTIGIATVLSIYLGTHVAWPWFTVIGSLVTMSAGLLISSFGRRTAALSLLLLAGCASMTSPPPAPFEHAEIDRAITRAIDDGKTPGGVYHLERDGRTYERAYGDRSIAPNVEPTTIDTIYDAASLTKVMATTPAIWLLIQRRQLALDDSVSKYIPEFAERAITIRHLLTHTSGLRPDVDLDVEWSGHAEGIRRAIAETPRNRPGTIFRYSDINFILLGELVERLSGQPLNVFCQRELFTPWRMHDTQFLPPVEWLPRIAPTEKLADGAILRGAVHDPTARRMGGVAGHAGLFTTVHDVATYARVLLSGGGGVLKPEIVNMMTSDQSPPEVAVKRTGGFDLNSHYSRPRGELFPLGSYGHTGWTGGFFWIDPRSKTFYVFLSNRVHPDGKGSVTALQRTLGTLSARAAGVNAPSHGRAQWVVGGDAQNGIDVVVAQNYAPLRGLRLGLITNQSGIDRIGNPTADLLRGAAGVNVVALFSPEHGIRGVADEKVPDSVDPISGLPVYSLYGATHKPRPEQLANLDALVFDVQDIGTRFYTYIATLGWAMEAAADAKLRFIVLDRVNPIGGDAIEGPMRQGAERDTAFHDLPIRHGMTAGELARMFREERHIDVELTVIPIAKWSREQWQDEAGMPWINTSPNMRSLTEAALYPGVGILESAVSVGRGTPSPFEVIGAPYIDGETLARGLNAMTLPGVTFAPIRFTPNASIFANRECGGVRIAITDRKALQSVATGIAIAVTLQRLYPNDFALDKLQPLLRDERAIAAIRAGKPVAEIIAMWSDELAAFAERRKKFLLY